MTIKQAIEISKRANKRRRGGNNYITKFGLGTIGGGYG